jgi:hypothetical protein
LPLGAHLEGGHRQEAGLGQLFLAGADYFGNLTSGASFNRRARRTNRRSSKVMNWLHVALLVQ